MTHTLQCSQSYTQHLTTPPNPPPKTNIRFKCLTCNMYICKVCAEICHRSLRHDVVFHGRTEFDCDCVAEECLARDDGGIRKRKMMGSGSATEDARQKVRHFYNPLVVDSPYAQQHEQNGTQTQWCTYMLTATYQTYQMLYACRTCQKAHKTGVLEGGASGQDALQHQDDPSSTHAMVCELCRHTCHAGHDIDTVGVRMQALCDCGAGNCVTSPTMTKQFLEHQHEQQKMNVIMGGTHSTTGTYSHGGNSHPRSKLANLPHHHHSHHSSYVQQPFIESSGRINCRNIVPKIRISAPPKTGQHVCIIDGDSLLSFAGAFEYVCNDMVEYSMVSSAWFRITQQGEVPGIRSAHSGCKHGSYMYIFGGVCGSERYNVVYRFNLSNYRWERLDTTGQIPQARYFTSLVSYEDSLYCVGGMLDDNNGDSNLYRLNLRTNVWTKINTIGATLPRINGMSVVVHEPSACMLVFGGYSHGVNKFSNTLYSFNFKTNTWTKIAATGSIPHRRAYHTAILGAPGTTYQHSMFLFGGKCPISLEKDRQLAHEKEVLFEYKIKEEKWVKVCASHIENVFFHQAVEHDCCLYFFGGNNRQNECFGFFSFNLDTQEWSTVQGTNLSSTNIRKDFLYYLLDEHVCADLCIELANGEEFLAHSLVVCRSGALKQLIEGNIIGGNSTKGGDEIENLGDDNDNNSTLSPTTHSSPEAGTVAAKGVEDVAPTHSFEPVLVKLHSEDPLIFQQVLYFLYGSEHLMVHQPDSLLQLMKRAQSFELCGLVEKSTRALERFINTDRVIDLLTEAHEHKLHSLKNKCIAFIFKNYDEMINMSEIASLPAPVLLEVARSKGSNFQPSDLPSTKCSPLAEVSLLDHLRKIKSSKEYSDIVLVTSDGFEIRAHRGVLAAQCEYFRSLFTGNFAESFQRRIRIDMPKRIVDIVLHFFYTGELNVDSEDNLQLLMEVSYYCDWILLESLERVCQEKLIELISEDNILEMLRLCSLNRGHKFVDIIKARAVEEFKKIEKDDLIRMFVQFATESPGESIAAGGAGSDMDVSVRELTSTDAEEADEEVEAE